MNPICKRVGCENEVKERDRQFCSAACSKWKNNHELKAKVCERCGTQFAPKPGQYPSDFMRRRYCSTDCSHADRVDAVRAAASQRAWRNSGREMARLYPEGFRYRDFTADDMRG